MDWKTPQRSLSIAKMLESGMRQEQDNIPGTTGLPDVYRLVKRRGDAAR